MGSSLQMEGRECTFPRENSAVRGADSASGQWLKISLEKETEPTSRAALYTLTTQLHFIWQAVREPLLCSEHKWIKRLDLSVEIFLRLKWYARHSFLKVWLRGIRLEEGRMGQESNDAVAGG